jgi:two-component system, chemotaxis family, sensor kinase CheA
VDVTAADVDALIREVQAELPRDQLLGRLEELKHERVARSFRRLTEQLHSLAAKLQKPAPQVVAEDSGLRLPEERFGGFWSSAVHLMRNLMDHGLERPADRQAAGKPPRGTVVLRARNAGDRILLEVSDDGRGIAWDRVAEKAARSGLPHDTPADLERALLSPGFSTSREVTEISGRGVGLSAVADRCRELGGTLTLASTPGQGTRFVFSFPRSRPS